LKTAYTFRFGKFWDVNLIKIHMGTKDFYRFANICLILKRNIEMKRIIFDMFRSANGPCGLATKGGTNILKR